MAPYVGEIRMVGFNFPPAGWAFCDGHLLPISENETLFNLIGTTYGGDGQETFALPNLQSRVPMHVGNGFVQAETGGVEEVTLTVAQIPGHNHPVMAGLTNQVLAPDNAIPAQPSSGQAGIATFDANTPALPLRSDTVGQTGGNQPHSNIQPYLAISFILSLFGVFPSQN